jgi:hypothetical protein
MATLLEIADDVRALSDLLDGLDGGEIQAGDQATALDKWFDEIGGAEKQKLDNYAALIRECELRAAVRREEKERLAKLVSAEDNKARRLKDRLKLYLEITGKKKIETDRYRISLCGIGGRAPLDKPADARALPPRFVITRYEADTDAIRAALEAGEEVDGCRLKDRGSYVKIS